MHPLRPASPGQPGDLRGHPGVGLNLSKRQGMPLPAATWPRHPDTLVFADQGTVGGLCEATSASGWIAGNRLKTSMARGTTYIYRHRDRRRCRALCGLNETKAHEPGQPARENRVDRCVRLAGRSCAHTILTLNSGRPSMWHSITSPLTTGPTFSGVPE